MATSDGSFKEIRSCRKCHQQGLIYRDNLQHEGYPVFFESGNLQSDVIFILEAPNYADSFDPDKKRLTYDAETDPTGRFVRECLTRYLLLQPHDVYFTNAVLCLPDIDHNGKFPVKRSHIVNCAPNIRTIIDHIDPKVVVTMGGKALSAIRALENHSLQLSTSVASPHDWYSRILFPMYHPGRLGRVTRPESQQRADFIALANVLRDC